MIFLTLMYHSLPLKQHQNGHGSKTPLFEPCLRSHGIERCYQDVENFFSIRCLDLAKQHPDFWSSVKPF